MTTAIVLRPRFTRRHATPSEAHAQFSRSRTAMIAAWRDWIATAPASADIEAEITGTLDQMAALRDLGRARP